MDLFKSTLVSVQRALDTCGLEEYHEIDEILFVGGSTQIPKIRQLVQDYLWWNPTPIRGVNPIEAVAYGAAVQASMLTYHANIYDRIIMDIVPVSLGVEEGYANMSIVIEHGTTIPCARSKTFTTAADNQDTVTIKIFEGEKVYTKHNHFLGTFDLNKIPPAPRGVPLIKVTFEVGIYGILQVSAYHAGETKSITIKTDENKLSRKEIEEKAGKLRKFAEQDTADRKEVEARDKFEGYIYAVINQIKEIGSELKDTDRNFVEKALEDQLAWLEEHKDLEVSEIEHQKRILAGIVHARISKLAKSSANAKGNRSHQEL